MKKKININEDNFELLRLIDDKPELSQRELAASLDFSLGKLNYCMNELKKKGLIKIQNFKKKNNKLNYLRHILTSKGILIRTQLTINFMKKKFSEYEQLKKDLIKKNIIKQ